MKRLYFLSTILLISTLLYSCKKENKTKGHGKPSQQLFPLAMNNQWQYHVKVYDMLGTVVSESDRDVVIDTCSVVDGHTFYGSKSDEFMRYNSDENTVLQLRPTDGKPFVRYKVVSEETLIDSFTDNDGIRNDYYTSPEQVMVNGYQCYVVYRYFVHHPNTLLGKIYHYIAPGIGLVAYEEYIIKNRGDVNEDSTWCISVREDLKNYYLY